MATQKLRRAIAVDFDGCICKNEYPKIGEPIWHVIDAVKKEKASGTGIILWTCRTGELLNQALDACKKWGIEFDTVNDSLPEWKKVFSGNPRKVGASEYWDDKARRVDENNVYKYADSIAKTYQYGEMLVSKSRIEVTNISGSSEIIPKGNKVVVGFDELAHHLRNGYIQAFSEYTDIKGFCSDGIIEIIYSYLRRRLPLSEMLSDYDVAPEAFKNTVSDALEEIGLYRKEDQ